MVLRSAQGLGPGLGRLRRCRSACAAACDEDSQRCGGDDAESNGRMDVHLGPPVRDARLHAVRFRDALRIDIMLKIRTSAAGAGHRAPAAPPSASPSFRLAQYRIVCIWKVMLWVPPWPGASSLLIRSYWRARFMKLKGAM